MPELYKRLTDVEISENVSGSAKIFYNDEEVPKQADLVAFQKALNIEGFVNDGVDVAKSYADKRPSISVEFQVEEDARSVYMSSNGIEFDKVTSNILMSAHIDDRSFDALKSYNLKYGIGTIECDFDKLNIYAPGDYVAMYIPYEDNPNYMGRFEIKGEIKQYFDKTVDRYDTNTLTVNSDNNYASVGFMAGRSMRWNQLCKSIGGNSSTSFVFYYNYDIGKIKVFQKATSESVFNQNAYRIVDGKREHKYYIKNTTDADLKVYQFWTGSSRNLPAKSSIIYSNSVNYTVALGVSSNVEVGEYPGYIMAVDLTSIYGAGNEPTVEEFEEIFSENHYPYNPGEVIHANVDKVVSRGLNSEEIDRFTIPSDFRTAHPEYAYGIDELINNWVNFNKTKYSNMKSVDLGSLGWVYNEAQKRFYAFLEGIKVISDGSTKGSILTSDYSSYSFNEMSSDGTLNMSCATKDGYVTLRNLEFSNAVDFKNSLQGSILHYEAADNSGEDYEAILLNQDVGVVDLGSLNWTYNSNQKVFVTANPVSDAKTTGAGICAKYERELAQTWWTDQSIDKVIAIADNYVSPNKNIYVRDMDYTAVAAFKSAVTGVPLYYELAATKTYDVTSYFKGLNVIEIQNGGSIKFENPYNLPIDFDVVYKTDKSVMKDIIKRLKNI